MYIYRVQVEMINYRQVDISSDEPLPYNDLKLRAVETARLEFGDCDVVEVEQSETVSQPIEAAT